MVHYYSGADPEFEGMGWLVETDPGFAQGDIEQATLMGSTGHPTEENFNLRGLNNDVQLLSSHMGYKCKLIHILTMYSLLDINRSSYRTSLDRCSKRRLGSGEAKGGFIPQMRDSATQICQIKPKLCYN